MTNNKNNIDPKRMNLLRLPEVCKRVGLSKPSIYRLMKDKKRKFPKSIKIGERATAWREWEIDEYILSR